MQKKTAGGSRLLSWDELHVFSQFFSRFNLDRMARTLNFQDSSPSSHVCLRMIQDVRRLGIISGLSRREKSRISV